MMGLFKKKEPREIKETDNIIVKLWYNPRTHAMMVLGLYFIFFLILLVMINTTPKNVNKTKNKSGSSLINYFTSLDNKKINYSFIIKTNDKNYLFNGSVIDNYVIGTLTDNENKFLIKTDNDECKVLDVDKDGNYIELETICPDKIDYKYFNYHNIYELIKNEKLISLDDNIYKVNLNKDKYVIIKIKEKSLQLINIVENDSEYELKYITEDAQN